MTERNIFIPHDTEDKRWWLIHGEDLEYEFVNLCRSNLNLDMVINPGKETDPTLPDLIFEGGMADLKCQHTPFFTAGRYGYDPKYTVTFNRKDYERYKSLYPDIQIFFWIDWKQLSGYGAEIDYLGGIYTLPFKEICSMIEAGAPEHGYIRRRNDNRGNAKTSFLLDIRKFDELFSNTK